MVSRREFLKFSAASGAALYASMRLRFLQRAYLLLDGANPWPIDPTRIVPMVIQDRMFDTNGQLYFPAGPPFSPNPADHPFWVPEFEGDVICVNGKVWPNLTVSNKRYAFWFLNGSNARTYNMFLTDPVSKNFGPPIWVIGTDGGLLDAPVKLDPTLYTNNSLTMMPGERYLAVINGGSAPFHPDTYYTEFPQEGETELWEIVNLTADAHPIHLHLVQFQLMNRQNFNVNKYSGAYAAAFVSSTGEIDPMTGLPYPNGVYMPEFGSPLAYDPASNPQSGGKYGGNPDIGLLAKNGKPIYLQGPAMPPLPQEAGWKDTVIMYPSQVTRIMVRWAPTDLAANTPAANAYFPFDPNGGHVYVWHCHIIDHENNEMMRPDAVTPNPGATRTYTKGTDY